MNYVDGLVAAVPIANKAAYIEHARVVGELLKECGALSTVECWGDEVPDGKVTSFPMAVKLEANEVVVFSWVTWPSKAAHDDGWKRAMADPRMQPGAMPMPFDGKRLIYGGFQSVLEL